VINSLPLLEDPWVFSQSHPLSTADMIVESKRRGVGLDAATLRAAYQRGDLVPLAEVTARKVGTPVEISDEPAARGSLTAQLRWAMNTGRIRDPSIDPYRPRLRFDSRKITDPPRWTNGLVYSQWQLLALPDLRRRLTQARVLGPRQHRRLALPEMNAWERPHADEHRRWAMVLLALEARYLPTVEPEWISLTNVEVEQWRAYRASYDSAAAAALLAVSGDEVLQYAEWLLAQADSIDPTGDWSRLIQRAPRKTWQTLSGDALIAFDHRLAAEILLCFYEDLDNAGHTTSLPEIPPNVPHPLNSRTPSARSEPLDTLLGRLGVSPHPGVVLAVEGETEELMVPRVFDYLGLRRTPDLVHILCIRGSDKQLSLVAAVSVAPLLGERRHDGYDMVRPPTRLMIVADRDAHWSTEAKVTTQRRKILAEIRKVVAAQGATLSEADLESLVVVHRWPGRCFEFAHFTDEEIATALATIDPTCGGLSSTELVARVSVVRNRGADVKAVWNNTWKREPNKLGLAEALWPVLRNKIDGARRNDTIAMPAVAEVVHEAYMLAQQSALGLSYVIRAGVAAVDGPD
jgi:hypothetical protein